MAGRNSVAAIWPAVAAMLLVAVPVALLEIGATHAIDRMLALALCILIVVVGLYIFVGNSGVYSFGHIIFMAIGAYSAALLTMRTAVKNTFVPGLPDWLIQAHVDPLIAVAVGVLLALLVAVVIGFPLMRLSGLTAGIATLAVLIVVNQVLANASRYTGGRQTLIGVAAGPSTFGLLLAAAFVIGIAYVFQRSRYGLLLRATREDAAAAESLGAEVVRLRRIAFVLSAGVMALGGGFYAETQRTVSVDSFFTDTTFLTMVMLIVGGVRSLAGAVSGVLMITVLSELLRHLEAGTLLTNIVVPTGTTEVVLALVMLFVLIRRPKGLTQGNEIVWPFPGALHHRRLAEPLRAGSMSPDGAAGPSKRSGHSAGAGHDLPSRAATDVVPASFARPEDRAVL